jgi:hypothetical protein
MYAMYCMPQKNIESFASSWKENFKNKSDLFQLTDDGTSRSLLAVSVGFPRKSLVRNSAAKIFYFRTSELPSESALNSAELKESSTGFREMPRYSL